MRRHTSSQIPSHRILRPFHFTQAVDPVSAFAFCLPIRWGCLSEATGDNSGIALIRFTQRTHEQAIELVSHVLPAICVDFGVGYGQRFGVSPIL